MTKTNTHKSLIVPLPGEAETITLGKQLAKCLNHRGKVYLRGDLGAGKTTFCRGILRALDHKGAVKSPTFTIVEPYSLPGGQVYHFDLYRLIDPEELEYIGIDDYLDDRNLCLVEWPEKAQEYLPVCDLDLELLIQGRSRCARFTAYSGYGSEVLGELEQVIEIHTK
jgi:tRNA threonylcarbamoyladenosine biosynthesis protein TsaE